MSASAPMAYTTARTAGKLATFPSRAIKVTTDCKLYRLQIDPDPRFAAGAGGLAHFLADAAGMTSDAATELQKAVVRGCNAAFETLRSAHAHLTVTFACYLDRIEVALVHEGSAADQLRSTATLSGIDRVQQETVEGSVTVRLTKYFRPAPRIA
jgi:hypothetical protein